MLITRIELENIKSYRQIVVDFRRGTTAISGANGAGKTTLVEAVGFALFNHLPYSQEQFVREGEKYGRIVVHLLGSDDRPYTVERRCGSGARWFITDHEANMRVEQRVDVLDKLHELFGIDRERPLDSLFKDALGVPQGTFTAIFLEPASKRKQTFDALLQIEDYKVAADNLLETQRYYKDQMQKQQGEINRLSYETSELEEKRARLEEARRLDEQQKEQNTRWTLELAQHEERRANLIEQKNQLDALKQQYEFSRTAHGTALERLNERAQQLQDARTAQEIVAHSLSDFERYRQAEQMLKRLRRDEQQRNTLLQQRSEQDRRLAKVQANIVNWQERLADVANARVQVVALAPLVDQQIELEKQRDELNLKVNRYETVLTEGKRLNAQLAEYVRKREGLQRKIKDIEPLLNVAALLTERSEQLTQLRIQASERGGKLQQLQEKRGLLQEKQFEREQHADKLRKIERNIEVIEEHRVEAEEVPVLQEQFNELGNQKLKLESSIDAHKDAHEQSRGGQCPLLHEGCLNIKQRGLGSLEFYFDGLLKNERAQLAELAKRQDEVTERIGQLKKYFDALGKLGQYVDRRDFLAEQLQRVAIEANRLERDINDLSQDLEELKGVEQQIAAAEAVFNESKSADAKTRDLPGLYKQVQQLQEQEQQCDELLRGYRQEAESLNGSNTQLKQVKLELEKLNDPRSRSKTQQAMVAQEGRFAQQLQEEQQKEQELQQQLQGLQEQLAVYKSLDADIGLQDAILQQSQSGHQNYLQNVKVAQLLPEREQAYKQQQQATERAAQGLREAEEAYQAAQSRFNESDLVTVLAEIDRLRGSLAALAQHMQHHQELMRDLELWIEIAEAKRVELEAAQKEYQTLEDLHTMTGQFRALIKEAAPYVLKAMLGDISAEANRIFGEIMGDRTAQLAWQNDYEVVLRRQSVQRSFAQLSGGEQMSAALAVRLALLKKLSTLNLAFFDEPTQNMDELRRTNLADQIRRVRGFDQLIVISHDDTFEQGLDGLVRLQKQDGETRLLSEDEGRVMQREQVQLYAS